MASPNGLAVLAALLWAASVLMWDVGVAGFDPIAAALLANLLPAIAYAAWALRQPAVRPVTHSTMDGVRLIAASCLYGGGIVASLFALKFAGAGLTAILLSSTPLFAVPLSIAFADERPSVRSLLGVALCLTGVVLVLWPV